VSAHLVISLEGVVHEIVPCWDGVAYRAGHAGASRWLEKDVAWENFNGFSLGIEIVNRNGNVFPFTQAQYAALAECLLHLKRLYPPLQTPERVVGHEHIAGRRGKVDPGVLFDWGRLFEAVYPGARHPPRLPVCPLELSRALGEFVGAEPSQPTEAARFWRAVSSFTETTVALIVAASSNRGTG
jgi:N-acetylmuramoyl-L-alanine amidase